MKRFIFGYVAMMAACSCASAEQISKRMLKKAVRDFKVLDMLEYMSADTHEERARRQYQMLQEAAALGAKDSFEFLLKMGSPVEVRPVYSNDFNECTPLHWAVKKGYLGIVKRLVAKGADVNRWCFCDDRYGMTPLMYATETGNSAMAEYLLNHGAQIRVTNSGGETALNRAMRVNNSIVTLLLQRLGFTVAAAAA